MPHNVGGYGEKRPRHVAWAVLWAIAVVAPPLAGQESRIPALGIEGVRLENGLQLLVHEDRSSPIVAVNVYYDVGSAREREGRSGFAHLFEHMLFQETRNLERGELGKLITSMGGTWNGTTNQDRTMYFEIVPKHGLERALWLEAERMAHLVVDEENLRREVEVVKEERRLRIDNTPYGNLLIAIDTLASHYGPYQHTPIGTMADLEAATVRDVTDFHREYYGPNNATIVLAGDVDLSTAKPMVESLFGWIPRGPDIPAMPAAPPAPRTDGERVAWFDLPLAQLPMHVEAYTIPPADHVDREALLLLGDILASGQSSRLHRRLVREDRVASSVFLGVNEVSGPGRLSFGGIPVPGSGLDPLVQAMREEISLLVAEGVTSDELQKAQDLRVAGEIQSRQTVLSKSILIQEARLRRGDPLAVNDAEARWRAVSIEDVQRVGARYLTTTNRAVLQGGSSLPSGDRTPEGVR